MLELDPARRGHVSPGDEVEVLPEGLASLDGGAVMRGVSPDTGAWELRAAARAGTEVLDARALGGAIGQAAHLPGSVAAEMKEEYRRALGREARGLAADDGVLRIPDRPTPAASSNAGVAQLVVRGSAEIDLVFVSLGWEASAGGRRHRAWKVRPPPPRPPPRPPPPRPPPRGPPPRPPPPRPPPRPPRPPARRRAPRGRTWSACRGSRRRTGRRR